jgi:GT2 family glycosyltransferase
MIIASRQGANQEQRISPHAPFVSIIIVNWNGAEVLPRCLQALKTQTYTDYEIIVVDNGSEDRSVDMLLSQWPDVHLIRLGENKGYAVANNIGAKRARGAWLALVNIDAFLSPNWLEILVDATQRNKEYSFFGACLLQDTDPSLLDGAGDVYHISGLAWRRYYNHPLESVDQKVEEIFGPCAAAALYSRQAFNQVGGFDEGYFSYHEDVDLSFRLRLNGFRCLYVPDAIARHIGSASTSKQSDFAVYYGHRNLVWSFFQNMPTCLLWKYLPAHLFANLIYLVYYSLRGQSRAIWRAKWHALRGLPAALRKRKIVQSHRKATAKELDKVIQHGWLGPYLLGFRARQQASRKLA